MNTDSSCLTMMVYDVFYVIHSVFLYAGRHSCCGMDRDLCIKVLLRNDHGRTKSVLTLLWKERLLCNAAPDERVVCQLSSLITTDRALGT